MSYQPADFDQVFGDRFASFKLLGKGGEGAVFAVWDRVRKADVAVKLAKDGGEPGLFERFEREYQILAVTRSDRLVHVFDHGRAMVRGPDGVFEPHFWYSMERCDANVRKTFPHMALAERLTVVMQMLDGLALLHAKNIAHRDIKPENLFLSTPQKGVRGVKIGDFGLATIARVAPNAVSGSVYGSPVYLAPERWQSEADDDWRPADQYAAAITLFELLSHGQLPLDFAGGHLRGHERSAVRPLLIPELHGRGVPMVDDAIRQMLAKRPQWRHPDVASCKRELEAALLNDGVTGG